MHLKYIEFIIVGMFLSVKPSLFQQMSRYGRARVILKTKMHKSERISLLGRRWHRVKEQRGM